jgi:uncharacterized protein
MKKSCIYAGQVRHRRFTPRSHQFSYKLFLMYLDLSELPSVFDRFWLWSIEKTNIATFRRRDHLGDKKLPLDTSVRDHIEETAGRRPMGPIRLLTHLSYFGYRFNPVSFYYCFDEADENLEFIVAEVNNTPWGEQYCYVLDSRDNQSQGNTADSSNRIQRYFENKRFHVSPFMPMDMQYDWRFSTPGDALSVHMENHQNDRKVFDATLKLEQRQLTGRNLAMALVQFPFITMKIVAAIYYQALLLWLKKIPFVNHPKDEAPESVKSA